MKKEKITLFLFLLLGLSLLATFPASAQGEKFPELTAPPAPGDVVEPPADLPPEAYLENFGGEWDFLPDPIEGPFKKFLTLWEEGEGVTNNFAKWLILVVVVILIYAALLQIEIPKNVFLRWIIAIIAGFLATMFINTSEIMTVIQSYSALGLALLLFLPIIVLGGLTILVASKASPIGIYLQKILWVLYSVFLFIKAGFALLAKWAIRNEDDPSKWVPKDHPFISFFLGDSFTPMAVNTPLLTVLVVAAIAIFVIMVMKGDVVNAWLVKEKRDADMLKYKDTAKRAKAARETDADMTRS